MVIGGEMKKLRGHNNCLLPSSAELRKGVCEFNAGAWFECHETLEQLWYGERDEAGELYQGILQVAVGLYHWRNGNYRGAIRLLRTGAQLLGHLAPVCQDVDITALISDTECFRERLESLGEEQMAFMENELIPRIRMGGSIGEKL